MTAQELINLLSHVPGDVDVLIGRHDEHTNSGNIGEFANSKFISVQRRFIPKVKITADHRREITGFKEDVVVVIW